MKKVIIKICIQLIKKLGGYADGGIIKELGGIVDKGDFERKLLIKPITVKPITVTAVCETYEEWGEYSQEELNKKLVDALSDEIYKSDLYKIERLYFPMSRLTQHYISVDILPRVKGGI